MIGLTTVPTTTTLGTTPRRRDPFDLLTQMQGEFDRFWGSGWPVFRPLQHPVELSDTWTPRADIFAHNGTIVVKAELPGVKKEDIEVAIEEGDLVIRGERKAEEKVEEKDYFRLERAYGSFYRRLPLPEGVTPEQITATFTEGVLEVTVPKPIATEPEPKKIAVK
jgi:HSP20 family protein